MKYDCTKTVDFIHERTRICKFYTNCDDGCPLNGLLPYDGCYDCVLDMVEYMDKIIPVVQKWSNEHPEQPKLTKREYEFLKTFIVSTDKAICRGKLMDDLYIHDARGDMYYGIDPTMFSFIREEEQMTFGELLSLEVEE